MTTRQQPGLHRIEVDRDIDGRVTAVRFVCDGTSVAACHSFPDCDCETWTRELHGTRVGQRIGIEKGHVLVASEDVPPQPGHEDVVHERECWVDPWFNGALSDVVDWLEAYDGELESPLDELKLRSGRIDTTFEGDMTWEYAS